MREIPLSQGKTAVVDDEDYEYLNQFSWSASWSGKKWYVVRRLPRTEKHVRGKKVFMHRAVLKTDLQVDHVNGDGLDNRRENLRPATNSQNAKNRGKQRDNTSGFKGVSRRYGRYKYPRWVAQIKSDGSSTIYIGLFRTPEDAARAYDVKAKELHGEFARLNFPDEAAA